MHGRYRITSRTRGHEMLGLADRSATTGGLRRRAPVPHTPLLPSTGLSPVRLRRVNLRRGSRVGDGTKPPSSSQRSICLAGMSESSWCISTDFNFSVNLPMPATLRPRRGGCDGDHSQWRVCADFASVGKPLAFGQVPARSSRAAATGEGWTAAGRTCEAKGVANRGRD